MDELRRWFAIKFLAAMIEKMRPDDELKPAFCALLERLKQEDAIDG